MSTSVEFFCVLDGRGTGGREVVRDLLRRLDSAGIRYNHKTPGSFSREDKHGVYFEQRTETALEPNASKRVTRLAEILSETKLWTFANLEWELEDHFAYVSINLSRTGPKSKPFGWLFSISADGIVAEQYSEDEAATPWTALIRDVFMPVFDSGGAMIGLDGAYASDPTRHHVHAALRGKVFDVGQINVYPAALMSRLGPQFHRALSLHGEVLFRSASGTITWRVPRAWSLFENSTRDERKQIFSID